MKTRIVVLGAGFGGLELTTILSDAFGDAIDIVLIDKGDAFVFGFSKLDVMFGRQMAAEVRHPYRDIVKPGVRFLQSTVRSIDPAARRVVTDDGTFEADVLVVALGADLDPAATPGLVEGGNEFYTVAGAFALRDVLPRFERGPAIIGVTGKSFKCPPAPSETALLLHDYLTARGRREATEISVVMPFGTPIPPSPDTSRAILAAFAERGIRFVKDSLVQALDPGRKVAVLSDGTEMPYELFLGVPVHRVPAGRRRVRACRRCLWLGAGEQEDAGNELSRCLRGGRRERRGHSQGGCLRRRRGARRGGRDHRAAPRRAVTRGLQGSWLLLCGVRPRSGRTRGRGLSERPKTHGHFPGAIRGARRREGPCSDPAGSSAGSDNRRSNLGKSNVGESALGGSIWRRYISSVAVTPVLIATFRPGVQAWKRSCNSVLTTVPRNTT